MLLSILIPTLTSRRARFEWIHAKLMDQIRACGWEHRIEILSLADRGEVPTWTKRNALMARARCEFIVGVDDDDDVSECYVELIGGALVANPTIDCIEPVRLPLGLQMVNRLKFVSPALPPPPLGAASASERAGAAADADADR